MITSFSIKPSNLDERKRVWAKMSSLLTTYSKLYLDDHTFLLEVIIIHVHRSYCIHVCVCMMCTGIGAHSLWTAGGARAVHQADK